MKLLYFFPGLHKGGISNVFVNRMNYLSAKLNYEVHIAVEGKITSQILKELNPSINA